MLETVEPVAQMRLLIDECLDWRICRHLSDHDCVSVQRMGWGGLKNGILLRKAEREFDAFITADRNLSFQQEVSEFDIAVVILCSPSTQLRHVLLLIPGTLSVLEAIKPGQVVLVNQ